MIKNDSYIQETPWRHNNHTPLKLITPGNSNLWGGVASMGVQKRALAKEEIKGSKSIKPNSEDKKMLKKTLVLLSLLFVLLSFSNAYAQDPPPGTIIKQVTGDVASLSVTWFANTEPDLAGYRIYYGELSGQYGPPIDITDETNLKFQIKNLKMKIKYFVAMTAYNLAGMESGFSQEASATTLGPPMVPKGPGPLGAPGVSGP